MQNGFKIIQSREKKEELALRCAFCCVDSSIIWHRFRRVFDFLSFPRLRSPTAQHSTHPSSSYFSRIISMATASRSFAPSAAPSLRRTSSVWTGMPSLCANAGDRRHPWMPAPSTSWSVRLVRVERKGKDGMGWEGMVRRRRGMICRSMFCAVCA